MKQRVKTTSCGLQINSRNASVTTQPFAVKERKRPHWLLNGKDDKHRGKGGHVSETLKNNKAW